MQRIIARHPKVTGALIPMLQELQAELGWLPKPALEEVARRLDLPLGRVYGVASFYSQFSLKPRGKHVLRVCLGTACHVRGASAVLGELDRFLSLDEDGLSEDGRVTVEQVRCLGACALAPVVVTADGNYHGGMTPTKVRSLVECLGGADDD